VEFNRRTSSASQESNTHNPSGYSRVKIPANGD